MNEEASSSTRPPTRDASRPSRDRHEGHDRRKRRNETLYRKRRIRFAVAVVVLCLAVVGIVLAATAGGSSAQGSGSTLAEEQSATAAVNADPTTTPAFARLRDRNLLLPVRPDEVTILAYQPVADPQAVQFTPVGEQVNSNALVRFFRGIFSGQPTIRYYLLPGQGNGDSGCILVGAPAGSAVTAPVSGTVTAVKQYSLFGKYDDVEIDIRPEEMPGVTLTMLLIDDPAVSMGEVVTAGKTSLGKVREVPQDLGKQLSVYTHDSGAHVIIQATEEPTS